MNTPAHVVASAIVFRTRQRPERFWASLLGAIVPDAPMFVFYGYQKLVGEPEKRIWSELYFRDNWQIIFDVFNSVPICGLLLIIALWFRRHGWCVFFASMLLHAACDFPLHYDDAHRHFWPLSNWRFQSPVSYWDWRHFGAITVPLEAIFAIAGSVWLARDLNVCNRALGRVILCIYAAVLCAAVVFTMGWFLS